MKARILPPPTLSSPKTRRDRRITTRSRQTAIGPARSCRRPRLTATEDPANAGIRREPELPEHEEIVPEPKSPVQEFEPMDDEPDDEAQRQRVMQRKFGAVARQVPLDPGDDMRM